MRWSLVFLGGLCLVSGMVEIANAYQSLSPMWGKDGFWTGIILIISGLIGLLGLWKKFWEKPFFWEGV